MMLALPTAELRRGGGNIWAARPLNRRDWATLAFIANAIRQSGSGPSIEQIRRHLGLRSEGQAALVIDRLRRRGLIDRSGPPLPGSRFGGLSIVGLAQ